jgi:hypothetical protein
MSSFIFQGVPERYDLRHKLKVGYEVSWVASRYRKDMHKDDIVYFWLGGDREYRGIYGWGVISSELPFLDDQGIYRIKVEYRKNFLDHDPPAFVSSDKINQDPVLQDLLIIRMPIGTNFLLTDSQDQALRTIISEELGPIWAPPTAGRNGGGAL